MLARYSLFTLVWLVLAALFAIAMTFRYKPTLEELAPAEWIVWLAMGIVWVAVFVRSDRRARPAARAAAAARGLTCRTPTSRPPACSSACSPSRTSACASGATR